MDRLPDALVRPAAADVAGHRVVDVRVGGALSLAQENGRRHDLPRLAVTALWHVLRDPGLLQGVTDVGGKPLNGGDLFARGTGNGSDARTHRFAVEVERAGAALGHPATELGPSQTERFPHHPQQRSVRTNVDRVFLAVDF